MLREKRRKNEAVEGKHHRTHQSSFGWQSHFLFQRLQFFCVHINIAPGLKCPSNRNGFSLRLNSGVGYASRTDFGGLSSRGQYVTYVLVSFYRNTSHIKSEPTQNSPFSLSHPKYLITKHTNILRTGSWDYNKGSRVGGTLCDGTTLQSQTH